MTRASYQQFCPVAMSAEILSTRWTMVLVRELLAGSTRFNDLRRGVPRMSPALLSRRLKELEAAGVVRRERARAGAAAVAYRLTDAGRALEPVVMAFGAWGQRWLKTDQALANLDVGLLMWDMRRNLDPTPLPARRAVVQFQYPELPAGQRAWWLLIEPNLGADLCQLDPGFEVDLYVSSDLKTMTAIWMGADTVRNAVRAQRLLLTGDRKLAAAMQTWLGLSPFARGRERRLAS
jgi:DNA-binding HxlR family transcriptional regulator